MPGVNYLRLPVPPPEFNLEQWRESQRLLSSQYKNGLFQRIAPTHFSIFEDASWHLDELGRTLDDLDRWICAIMPGNPPTELLNSEYLNWDEERAFERNLDSQTLQTYEIANPSWMAAAGIQRYWNKHRAIHG